VDNMRENSGFNPASSSEWAGGGKMGER